MNLDRNQDLFAGAVTVFGVSKVASSRLYSANSKFYIYKNLH